MAIDEWLVLRRSEVSIVVGDAREAVHICDVAGVEQVANPQVNIEVGGLGCFALSFAAVSDSKVFVQVRVQIELPRQATSID